MPRTPSAMIDLGTACPDFRLPDANGQQHGLADAGEAPAVLVAFICNHCPFVKHLADRLSELTREFGEEGLVTFAINSNDYTAHPEDAPGKMIEEAELRGYGFPYLIDEDQEVARSFGAACTPDFFGFDAKGGLQYRGRLDASRMSPAPEDAPRELFEAMKQVADTGEGPRDQVASVGCSIKWKPAA